MVQVHRAAQVGPTVFHVALILQACLQVPTAVPSAACPASCSGLAAHVPDCCCFCPGTGGHRLAAWAPWALACQLPSAQLLRGMARTRGGQRRCAGPTECLTLFQQLWDIQPLLQAAMTHPDEWVEHQLSTSVHIKAPAFTAKTCSSRASRSLCCSCGLQLRPDAQLGRCGCR